MAYLLPAPAAAPFATRTVAPVPGGCPAGGTQQPPPDPSTSPLAGLRVLTAAGWIAAA